MVIVHSQRNALQFKFEYRMQHKETIYTKEIFCFQIVIILQIIVYFYHETHKRSGNFHGKQSDLRLRAAIKGWARFLFLKSFTERSTRVEKSPEKSSPLHIS